MWLFLLITPKKFSIHVYQLATSLHYEGLVNDAGDSVSKGRMYYRNCICMDDGLNVLSSCDQHNHCETEKISHTLHKQISFAPKVKNQRQCPDV